MELNTQILILMKKVINLSQKALKGSVFTSFQITISLEYKRFSLTCLGYGKRKELESGGADHTTILELRPDLKIFADLHLSDLSGLPMHAIENGWHWLQNDHKAFRSYLRLTDTQYSDIMEIYERETDFNWAKLRFTEYILRNLVPIWNDEALKAIKLFHELKGRLFV